MLKKPCILVVTSTHQSMIFLLKYLCIHCFFWIEIIQLSLNLEGASKCISQHHQKHSWIGENELVNWCHEQDHYTQQYTSHWMHSAVKIFLESDVNPELNWRTFEFSWWNKRSINVSWNSKSYNSLMFFFSSENMQRPQTTWRNHFRRLLYQPGWTVLWISPNQSFLWCKNR